MTDLLYPSGSNNIGGNFLIRYVPVIGVTLLPSILDGQVAGPPLFRDGFRWYQVYGTDSTKGYDEEHSETGNGSLWTVSVSLFLPGDSADRRKNLSEMVRHRHIVECQDNAGMWRRLGTIIENLTFTYKFGVGPQASDRRGAMLTFSGTMTSCPPIVIGI